MKRLIYCLFIVLFCSFAYSLTISITSPVSGDVLAKNEPFSVDVNNPDEEEITQAFFYYQNSPKDPWQELGSDEGENETSYSITFDTTSVSDSTTARIYVNATDSTGNLIAESSEISIDIKNTPDNNPPTINSYSPEGNPTVTITEEGTTITYQFEITKSDPENDPLTTLWYLGEQLVGNDTNEYKFSSNQPGNYTLKVQVSDENSTTKKEWTITLLSGWIKDSEENMTKEVIPECGNNLVEPEENCLSCPQDVKCPADLICGSEGKCIKEVKPKRWPIVLVLVIIVIVIVLTIVIYNKRSEKVYSATTKKEEIKEAPAKTNPEFYKEPKQKVIPKEPKVKKIIEPKKPKTVGSILLKSYVETAIAKRVPLSEIRENLIKKGWKVEDIEGVLKKYDTKKRS